MAIERKWINWATSITSAVLLIFCLAQVVVAFYLNLTTKLNVDEKLAVSGALLVSLGVLVFPTCWIGFSAAISRHRGVYIAFMVMVCLSILDSIGMLVYQAYRFSILDAYRDEEQAVAIVMTILQSLLIVILFFALAFGAAGLCYECPEHTYGHERKSRYPAYPMGYPASAPPIYSREFGQSGYPTSLPRPSGYEYTTEPRMYYSNKGRY